MPFVLRFAPTDDTVTLPTQFTVQLGNTNVVIEFRVALSSYPASGNKYFTGLLAGSTNEGLCLRQASGDGALALIIAGTNQAAFTSDTGFILNDGSLHTYRIERDAGTEIRFYRDGSIFQTKPWVTSSNFSLRIQRFGQGSTVTSGMLAHDFEYFKIVTGGLPSNEEWNANLSGGAGSVLPSVSGSNNGTLVNFDTAVCWVSYGGGSATLLAANLSSLSAIVANLTVENKLAASLSSTSAILANLTAQNKLSASLVSMSNISANLTIVSSNRIFPIDVTGIPDGTYPVALFNHTTGVFLSRQDLAFVSGHAELTTALTLGTKFSGYVIDPASTPSNGAVIFGQVANAP